VIRGSVIGYFQQLGILTTTAWHNDLERENDGADRDLAACGSNFVLEPMPPPELTAGYHSAEGRARRQREMAHAIERFIVAEGRPQTVGALRARVGDSQLVTAFWLLRSGFTPVVAQPKSHQRLFYLGVPSGWFLHHRSIQEYRFYNRAEFRPRERYPRP
jgi:hypothetical protein